MKSKYTVLDMFSGAGGLTEGFFQHGFKFVSHIEKNKHARNSIETRSIYHTLKNSNNEDIYRDYLLERLSREEFIQKFKELELSPSGLFQGEITESSDKSIIENIENHLEYIDEDSVDVIIGGPPCQAYSLAGRGRKPEEMKTDPRNYLYRYYISFLKHFEPKIFVFENVPGIKTANNGCIYSNLHDEVKNLGYQIEAHLLNSKDFSVLQERQRIIFIGWKDEYDLSYPEFSKNVAYRFNVSALLKDLPELQAGEGTDSPSKYTKSYKNSSLYLQRFNIRKKGDILIQHSSRMNTARDRDIYRRAIKKWDKEGKRLKYSELPSRLQTHKNKTSYLDRFKVVNKYGYSHSIVAHLSKDGHHFIHPDLNQARSLTVREAARIQSFPDNYKLEGPRLAQFAHIVNAVPPLMSRE